MSQGCRSALAKLDAYLDGELPERDHQLVEHYRGCTECTREAAARRHTRRRLQAAVQAIVVPSRLEARVSAALAQTQRTQPWGRHWMVIAAGVALCLASWTGYRALTALPGGGLDSLMRAGLGDHVHCAVTRQLTANQDSDEAPAGAPGPPYQTLLATAGSHLARDFRLVVAHECRHRGRRFIHLALRSELRLLSLVITRKNGSESFRTTNQPPALSRSGIALYAAGIEGFQVAAFESPDHLVYAVSDMPGDRNLHTLAAMAPAFRGLLTADAAL
jgi:anti-sigma factor RsiW